MLDNYPFFILHFPGEKPVKHTKGAVTYTYNQGLYVISQSPIAGAFRRYHGTITPEGVTWKSLSSVPTLPSFPKGNIVKADCEESIDKALTDFFKHIPKGTIIESGCYKSIENTDSIKNIVSPILINFFGEENVDVVGDETIVYFEKMTVSNGNATHEMHDIYIKVHRMYDYHLMRTSLSDAEKTVSYLFSHARKNPWGNWSELCLGESTTPISKSKSYFYRLAQSYSYTALGTFTTFFEIQLSSNVLTPFNQSANSSRGVPSNIVAEVESQAYIFCNNLLTYLQWESLSGGPYINLSTVINNANNSSDNSLPTVPDSILNEGFHRLLTTYKEKLVYEIYDSYGVPNIRCSFPKDILLKACEYKFIKAGSRILIYDPKLKSVPSKKVPVKNAGRIFTFKGKDIVAQKVIPGTNVNLDINNVFVPPIFEQFVQSKLNNLTKDVTTSFIKVGHRTSQT